MSQKYQRLPLANVLPLLLLILVTTGLAYVILSLPTQTGGLTQEVNAQLAHSGVTHPVTAVLLNFRGYDTLLEMMVLLLAVMGIWSLGGKVKQQHTTPGSILDSLSRILIPLLFLVAAYLLWVGAHAPGGAFQAGSILGASAVLMLLAGWRLRSTLVDLPIRIVLLVGPGAFVILAGLTLVFNKALLAYPPSYAGWMILILELLASLSIGVTLAALFLAGHPQHGGDTQ